jgi:hypothetical protein
MKRFKALPESLQRQVLLRFSAAAALLILGLVSALWWRDKSVLLIFVVALFFAAQAVRVCLCKYIVITGTCKEAAVTPIRKRGKSILLQTNMSGQQAVLRIMTHQKVHAGEIVTVYADARTPIYEWQGEFRLQSHLALDRRTTQ